MLCLLYLIDHSNFSDFVMFTTPGFPIYQENFPMCIILWKNWFLSEEKQQSLQSSNKSIVILDLDNFELWYRKER
jgi:hypothetical protein